MCHLSHAMPSHATLHDVICKYWWCNRSVSLHKFFSNMAFFNSVLIFLTANWFAISLAVCISFILYVWGIAPFRRSRVLAVVGDLPGPSPLPFLGNLLDLIKLKGQIHLHIDGYYKKYGRLFTMFLLTKRPSLIIGDPEMTKEILVKEFQSFHDRPVRKTLIYHILNFNYSKEVLKFVLPVNNSIACYLFVIKE